jgi:hypothetical protein
MGDFDQPVAFRVGAGGTKKPRYKPLTLKEFIMFKTLSDSFDRNNQERERQTELLEYKRLYFGLRRVAYPLFKKFFTVSLAREEGIFEQFVIAPGRRADNGSWTQPEIDWDAWNQYRYQRFVEMLHQSIDEPLEVLTLKRLQSAKRKLAKALLQEEEWKPLLDSLKLEEDSTACLFEKLRQINAEGYQHKKLDDAMQYREDLNGEDTPF